MYWRLSTQWLSPWPCPLCTPTVACITMSRTNKVPADPKCMGRVVEMMRRPTFGGMEESCGQGWKDQGTHNKRTVVFRHALKGKKSLHEYIMTVTEGGVECMVCRTHPDITFPPIVYTDTVVVGRTRELAVTLIILPMHVLYSEPLQFSDKMEKTISQLFRQSPYIHRVHNVCRLLFPLSGLRY